MAHKIKGKYSIYKVFRNSARRTLLRINLTENEARQVVRQYKSNMRSMVIYQKQ
jgi:hypothetical protein